MDIQLAPDDKSVTLNLRIYKDYPIYSDAQFAIEQSGFLGDQFVSVTPLVNQLPYLTNDEDVPCTAPFNLLEVARSASGFIQRIDGTAQKLDAAVSDLQRQVLNAQTLSSFGVAMTNMRSFSEQARGAVQDIHGLVDDNRGQIGVAVSNLVYFSAEMTQLGASAQGLLATNGEKINFATKNLADISETLKHVSSDLQSGNGSGRATPCKTAGGGHQFSDHRRQSGRYQQQLEPSGFMGYSLVAQTSPTVHQQPCA